MGKVVKTEQNPLWTHDFTIITVGSIISMLGNSMSSFAMSLMVLDISKSTLLYSLYITVYTFPQIVIPVLSGAVLDRFSRKKTIYTLDFISAGLYCLMAYIMAMKWFSFGVFLAFCFILGTIQSIYIIAYQSFYPLLISEGNYQKAYSVASVVETLAAIMVPVSTFLYNHVGIKPLLVTNSIFFFLAAIMETCIQADEHYLNSQRKIINNKYGKIHQIIFDIKEGFDYLISEKGLLAIAIYFSFFAFGTGVSNVITLPYFKYNFKNGEYIYMLVWGVAMIGRTIGSGIHYKIRIPHKLKYKIALIAHVISSILEGLYLFFNPTIMMLMCFIMGVAGVTGYTIRISATQSYVPDERKGRFNGTFNIINTVGTLLGGVIAGLLTVIISERYVLMFSMFLCALAAIVVIGGQKNKISTIYNRP